MPRVSGFVLSQRPVSLSALRVLVAGSVKAGSMWPVCWKSMMLSLIAIVNDCEIFTNKVIHTAAVVFECMKLCEDDQSFHDHRLQSCFRKTEIVGAGETGGGTRCRRGCQQFQRG